MKSKVEKLKHKTNLALVGLLILGMPMLNGCAVQRTPEDLQLQAAGIKLPALKANRRAVREQLTANPAASDAHALSAEIAKLNRLVTAAERRLGYSISEPITTEIVPQAYLGRLPTELLPTLRVASSAWESLTYIEQSRIEEKWIVQPLKPASYGVIVNSEVLTESSSALPTGVISQAERATDIVVQRVAMPELAPFRTGNSSKGFSSRGYSAGNLLAEVLVVTLIAELIDSRNSVMMYRTRYSVKLADGTTRFIDHDKTDPLRFPTSTCIQIPSLGVADQTLCTQTGASLRHKYLLGESPIVKTP